MGDVVNNIWSQRIYTEHLQSAHFTFMIWWEKISYIYTKSTQIDYAVQIKICTF